MAKKKNRVSQTARLDRIREKIVAQGEVTVDELATEFHVSTMTVHRDLESLEKKGEIIKTYGGATPAKRLTFEFSFQNEQQSNRENKVNVAAAAIKHIQDGQVIILDTGTTTLEIARSIGNRKVTIITTSLAIVSELQFDDPETILLGGCLRGGSPDMHGPLTADNLERFRADLAFIGADGIDGLGNTFTDDLRVASLSSKMAQVSEKTIVVADSTKIGRNATCKVLNPADYQLLITNNDLARQYKAELRRNNIQLELCKSFKGT
jgi:DeoR/GlpR family transcriptional regulator of sugar metabolism